MRPNSSRKVGAPCCLAVLTALAFPRRERSPRGSFAFEDLTGMLWIEIDIGAEIERAKAEVLARIPTAEGNRRVALAIKRDMALGLAQGL